MRKTFVTLAQVVAAAILVTALGVSAQDKKADPSGNWTWTTQGRDGNERKVNLTLKVEGDKVTGKVKQPGREGAIVETEIADAKLVGDTLSFTVTREFGGNKRTWKYNGKVAADTITGKVENEGRDGATQSRDWNAKREGAPAK
jgi:hypothetical protein